MTNVSRSDVYARDEKGPDWFNDLLESLANQKPGTVQDILGAIKNTEAKSVDSVVQNYRKQVGLDALTADTRDHETIKEASKKFRPLSIRHFAEKQSALALVESDEGLKQMIDSFCQHSGGTKSTHSIIARLREQLGDNSIDYNDEDLNNYIESRKNYFKHDMTDKVLDVGLVGTDSNEEPADLTADYATYDGAR